MKILMTADTVGGVWNYALELAHALTGQGVKVALATMGAPLTTEQRRAVRTTRNLTLYESSYQLEWMVDPWEDVARAGEWLLGLERQFRPDIIHLNNYVHAALPWRAPTLVVGHSCVLSWWSHVRRAPAPNEFNRYHREVGLGLQAARMVVAPTQAFMDVLNSYYGPLGRKRVLYNGCNPRRLQVAAKEPFVLAVGRLWDEAKNVGALADAAPRLDWPVYVAGEPQHPQGGRATFENLNQLGQLVPSVLASWYARAAIYAFPARYEPFGLSVLEAALSGCALVLGDLPSLREIWGDTALFVPPNDTGALEQAINGLIADPKRRDALAARSRRRARTYTHRRMVQSYLEVYEELYPTWSRVKPPAQFAVSSPSRLVGD